MEIALAALLVSSFTCVGLLAIWAATSKRHWFVRISLLVGPLLLLLLIPAHEALAILMLQGAVIVASFGAYQLWQRPRRDLLRLPRFPLRDVLLVFAMVAVAIPVGKRVWLDDWVDWTNVVQFGLAAAVCVLGAELARAALRKGKLSAVAVALAVPLALACLFAWREPPALEYLFYIDAMFAIGESPWYLHLWFLAFGATLVLVFVLHLLARRMESRAAKLALLVLILPVAVPAAYVYYRLMTPLPLPDGPLPSPNGYHDLVAAGRLADTRVVNFAAEMPVEKVRDGLQPLGELYARAELGLSRQIRVPLKYDLEDIEVDDYSALRSLCRAFAARARVSVAEGDLDLALADYRSMSQLGNGCANGGVLVHWFVATGIAGVGHHELYQIIPKLNAAQCRDTIAALEAAARDAEPYENVLYRERIWCERGYGFYGHLSVILDDVSGEENWVDSILETTLPRHKAERRLLITALAIRAYEDERGKLPYDLGQLVPQFLQQVPLDPFDRDPMDREQGALRYQLTDQGYQLYSVGQNGIDEGGQTPLVDANDFEDHDTGDLIASERFAPWEPDESVSAGEATAGEATEFGADGNEPVDGSEE